MTVRQLFVQTETYAARDDRLMMAALRRRGPDGPVGSETGIRAAQDLVLTMSTGQQGSVSKGVAYIPWAGSIYLLTNDAAATVNFDVAAATNARIDLVVAQVYDAEAGGPNQSAAIRVINGTPSANPVPPAVPAGAIALGEVRYNAGATTPVLTDRRVFLFPTLYDVACNCYCSTIQGLGQNSSAQLPMSNFTINRGGFAIAGGGLTIPVSGYYMVIGKLPTANSAGNSGMVGHMAIQVMCNDGRRIVNQNADYQGIWPALTAASMAGISAGQNISLYATSTSPGTIYVDPGAGQGGYADLSLFLISPNP